MFPKNVEFELWERQSIGELWDQFLANSLLNGRRNGFAFGCRAFCDGEGNENFRRTGFPHFVFFGWGGNFGAGGTSLDVPGDFR